MRVAGRPEAGTAGALLVLMALYGPATVLGEGLRDLGDGWLIPVGERAAILASPRTGYPEPAMSGAGGRSVPRWGWWLGAGQGHLYSLAELPLRLLELRGVRRSGEWPLAVGLSWERLGEGLFQEDSKALQLGLGRTARFGLRVRSRRWSVASERVDGSVEVGLRGGISFGNAGAVEGRIDLWVHATGLPRWHGRRGRRTLADLRVFHPGAGWALRVDQRGDGAPLVSLEVMTRLTSRVGLAWRIDPETGSLGGGLSAHTAGLWLQTSHLVHPALGATHRFYLGAGDPGVPSW